jgi:hypothetical protein
LIGDQKEQTDRNLTMGRRDDRTVSVRNWRETIEDLKDISSKIKENLEVCFRMTEKWHKAPYNIRLALFCQKSSLEAGIFAGL